MLRIKMVKKTLSTVEMYVISGILSMQKDEVQKEIVKVAQVAQIVFPKDTFKNLETCEEIYDFVLENGLYKKILKIDNYAEFNEALKQQDGLSHTIKMIINTMSEQIKNVDLDDIVKKFEDAKPNNITDILSKFKMVK